MLILYIATIAFVLGTFLIIIDRFISQKGKR